MDAPYRPRYKGFDEEATRNAQATADASRRTAAPGESVDSEYMASGPAEAAARTGRTSEEVGEAIERARRRARR